LAQSLLAPRIASRYSGLLVGPGLAADNVPEELKMLTEKLWHESPVPMVVDASALAWLPPGAVPDKAIRVITPHPGEAARLLDCTSSEVQANRVSATRALSKKYGNTWVVLKGHHTVVGRREGAVFVNCSGNPYLAQGGSGDVLSGFLAGLLAQPILQPDLLTAIRFAVWQHGAAADRLQSMRRNWVVEDLAGELGGVA
jgi:NAD(P)H-hydrate epimerase